MYIVKKITDISFLCTSSNDIYIFVIITVSDSILNKYDSNLYITISNFMIMILYNY